MENVSSVGFRLSPLQKLVWANPDLRDGTVSCRVLVEGQLDIERLRGCFKQVAEAHESLRTIFQVSPGFTIPFQIVREEPSFSWELYDLISANPVEQEAAIQNLLRHESWPAATPSEGPSFGVKIIKTTAERQVLALRVLALCCDSLSLENLITEVASLYQNRTAAEESVQYADFSEWHNETLLATSDDSDAAKVFWSVPRSTLQLPLQGRLPPAGNPSLAVYPFLIDPAVFVNLSTAWELFLLGCWHSMLWRLTNQDSITVDVICDDRPLDELQQSIGLFARPFPVSVVFEDCPSFNSVFQRLSEELSQVERWQAYCPINSNGTVGFEFKRLPDKIAGDAVDFTVIELRPQHWSSQLSLSCRVSGDTPSFEFKYNSTEFVATDIERLARYFECTVRAAVEDAKASVQSFTLLDEAERRQVVEDFNTERAEYTDSRAFHQIFEAQASLTPERLALVFEKTALTYDQLNNRANQIASSLRKFGVGPNTPVGLCLERSAEMIVALLGILKAGGVYVPLLPDMPAARLVHQIAETGLQVVISIMPLLEKLPSFSGRTLCLDRDQAVLEQEPQSNLPHTVTLNDLIYILYTSGSTGVPKGVAVSHGNVANYMHAISQRLGLHEVTSEPGLMFATVSTLGADLGNTSIFPALVTGGCVVVISYESALDGELFANGNREHPIDVLKITPSNLVALLAGAKLEDILPRKYLIVGGEACTWDLARQVKSAGVCDMLNHYGPTETTIGCLTYEIRPENDPSQSLAVVVPLGRPLPNTQVYILDTLLRPVPVGAPGEICISGSGLTRGYINREKETLERFVSHPLLPNEGSLYRSGDLGRFLPDGSIEFLGRVDDQVKIRGHRVELAEIESVLSRYPGVQQAIVLLSQDSTGQYLSAYLISSPDKSSGDLQQHLRQHLPAYMVPRDFVFIEQFPLNLNGKVDRRKLAEVTGAAAKVESDLLAPGSELEEHLIAIWKEVLKVERIGIRDNFFELGGHSLLATRIIARIRSSLGLNVSIRMLFEAPTVESLAQAIESTHVLDGDDSEISDLLAELEGLSDSQAEEILGGDYSPQSSATPGERE